jgi:nucleotide-binding universal stress UspA family protein
MLPIRTIIHPTDFTEHSDCAFQMACALARDYSAKLLLLHVYPTPVFPIADGGAFPVVMEMPREELLKDLNKMRPPDAAVSVERVLVEGDPAFEILRAADAYNADLIVMGTHGRGGLSRLVMGSVAEAVSRKSNYPVLTVRMPIREMRSGEAKTAQSREPVKV